MRANVVTAALLLLLGGCGHSIGDSCSTNVECSPQGDRTCDTAQLDGYCTLQGCDLASCPSEAVCIRFFSANFLSAPCNPATEDVADPKVTPTHDCTAGEICLSNGLCAQRTSERRFCMKQCDSDGDCRDGYACVNTGTRGAEALPDPSKSGPQVARFCAQRQSQ